MDTKQNGGEEGCFGGDDLLMVVGSWRKVVSVARRCLC